ncbi:MAG TPA: nucleoside triphosphate pyrophosphatase [Acidobacteriota bacterium]|nr:nucleoside triphosphate pyrophosphatase [Acidobacteriota bacterium]
MLEDGSRSRLILASGSPRRKELLQRFGAPFQIRPSGSPEDVRQDESPAAMAERLALDKARWVARRIPGRASAGETDATGLQDQDEGGDGSDPSPETLVLGADTTIDLEGEVLGKPSDPDDARLMLDRLRGRPHAVITGVALVSLQGGELSSAVATTVWMRDFTSAQRDAYVETGEPMGKAGSYAIQGAGGELVQRWQGCWNNVMGLPLCEVGRLALELTGRSLNQGPVCPQPYGSRCFY